jgi:tetratricopeptide (TPR) repeat protein
MMRKIAGFVVWAVLPWCVKAQDIIKLDSLQLALKKSEADTSRVNILLEISNLYGGSNYVKAIEYSTQALELARELHLPSFEARANMSIATLSLYQSDYKKASIYFFDALKYYEAVNDTA